MKILVTGGHGFIGSRVVRLLTEAEYAVRCLVRASGRTHRIDDLSWERTEGDLLDAPSLQGAMVGCDGCIHLASISSWEAIRSGAVMPTPMPPDVLAYATRYWFMDDRRAKEELGYRSRPAREVLEPTIGWLYESGHVF